MIKSDCPHNPINTQGAIGMYHCPICGEMQLAGYEHTSIMEESDREEFFKELESKMNEINELEGNW